ncbi:MAG TPA: HAD family hydrolase [Devosia sp.]|nr:HAD family hydrolase [Devosia sp.]
MTINSIIFDWDGTLGKTLHLWVAGYHRGMENQGHTFSDAEIVRDFFYEHDKGQEKFPHIDFSRLVNDAYAHLHEELPKLELYEAADETLAKLTEKGTELALVTSSPREILFRGMGAHNLEKYFSSIIAGDEAKVHKPHPAPFIKTMENTGMRAHDTLIIGDAGTDIVAGKAAGMKTCVFAPEENLLFHSPENLAAAGADFMIEKLMELVELV